MLASEPISHSLAVDFCPENLLSDRGHLQRIEQIARKQTHGTTLSWEDAAQAAQIKILQALRRGKFNGGEFGLADRQAFFRWATTVAKFEIIDLVRKEQRQRWSSLDHPIADSDLTRLDTIADRFDALDNLVRADLVERLVGAIQELEAEYPKKGFLALWQGHVQGKNQTELAAALGITQSAVSKRWKELAQRIAQKLGLLESSEPRRRTGEMW
jgi:RNA polymerase sigma factor (sigma-70 family)